MAYQLIQDRIHLSTDAQDRQRTELEITFHAGGSWFEEAKDRGKKHLLEHCLVSRTKELDFWQLKDYSFRENLNLNAYTSGITLGLEVGGHYSDFRKMVDLLLEFAFEPTFDQSILEREKEIVLKEISERRGEPNYRLYFETNSKTFTPESYENHEVLGSSEMVAETTLEDFHKLHNQNWSKSHILFNASGGGIDIDYLQQKLNSYLATQNIQDYQNLLPINYAAPSQFQDFQYRSVVSSIGHEHAEVYLYLPCQIDFQNRAAIKMFSSLFLRYNGVLYDRLRDELGLVYGLNSHFDQDLQALQIYLTCEIDLVPRIIEETGKVLHDFQTNFKPNKFEEFKTLIKKRDAITKDTIGSTSSFLSKSLRDYAIPESFDEFTARFDQVTIADVQAIYEDIKQNWDNKKVVVVSKNDKIEGLVV
jgi:predicted Zn-dependent peptidase